MIKKLLAAVVLVVVAYAGFRWGPTVFPPVERALGIAPRVETGGESGPTPEMAEETLDQFERFRAGEMGERLSFGGTEVTAVVRHALPGIVPRGVTEPTVELRDGKVHLAARVAVESFPRLPRLDQIVGLLPDTVLIETRGSLVPLDQRFLALLVDRVQVARIPIPGRMIPDVLEGLGRQGPGSLPPDGLAVPMPDGLESVFVQRDSLVLLAPKTGSRPGGDEGD